MQELLEHVVAEGILSGEYDKGTVLKATAQKGNIQLHCSSCVKEMFVRLYNFYYPEAIKSTETNANRKTKKAK